MTIQDAIRQRHSVRSYSERPVEKEKLEALQALVDEYNQQKFFFEYVPASDGQSAKVRAKRSFSIVGFTQIDLGIAKCHFEIGAGEEHFEWI